MIQVLSVTDENKKIELCAAAGISYSDSLHIIASFDDGGKMGCGAIFRYDGQTGEILWMDDAEKDKELLIGLGKAVLNIMDLRGVKHVLMPLKLESIAVPLRFERKQDRFVLDLEGYFTCGCQHN